MAKIQLDCDVLIVGAGPAGLSVAATLPKNIKVVILHQDKEIGRPVRTSGGTWVNDMQKLGVPAELYQVIDKLDFYSDNQEAKFDIVDQKMAVLDVTGLYQWLARKSQNDNRKLMLASKFLSTIRSPGGDYVSDIRSKTSDITQIRSKYIIDASGYHCAVLSALSLVDKPKRVGVGIEHEYPIGHNDPHRAILFVGSSVLAGYGWVFPTTDQRLRVGVGVVHPDTDTSPRKLMDEFLASPELARFGINLEGTPVVTNAGTIPSIAYEPKLVFDKIIRVGDSANVATPTVGEGIRICIEQGELLGKLLGDVISFGTTRPLDTYEKICREKFSKNYWIGSRANKKIATYTPKDWDKSILRIKKLSEQQLAAVIRSEFSVGLALSAIWKLFLRKLRLS